MVIYTVPPASRNCKCFQRGWIQARGEGKGRSWHLSAAVYRVLDAPAGYVRVHGFEPLQQEQMVLQYVDAHGQITLTEAAERCSLTPDQASRLLRRLAKEGKLELRGDQRDRNTSSQPDEGTLPTQWAARPRRSSRGSARGVTTVAWTGRANADEPPHNAGCPGSRRASRLRGPGRI